MSIEIDHRGNVALVTGSGAGIGRESRPLAGDEPAPTWSSTTFDGDNAERVVAEITDLRAARPSPTLPIFETTTRPTLMIAGIADQHGHVSTSRSTTWACIPPGRAPKPFVSTVAATTTATSSTRTSCSPRCADEPRPRRWPQAGGGTILFVSSGETTRPAPFTSVYAAAKAGLNHLVSSMAVELGPAGIRVLGDGAGHHADRDWSPPPSPRNASPRSPQSTPLRYCRRARRARPPRRIPDQRARPSDHRPADPRRRRCLPQPHPAPQRRGPEGLTQRPDD